MRRWGWRTYVRLGMRDSFGFETWGIIKKETLQSVEKV